MENLKRYFFIPHKGSRYTSGLYNGKKVMILGASFYCPKVDCEYYDACTHQWRTKEFDKKCPYNNGNPLSILPHYEIDEAGARSYSVFYNFMQDYLSERGLTDIKDFDDFWDRVAFTNYIQHEIGGRTTTQASDMCENDLLALCDAIRDLKPDIVVIWGCVVNNPIKLKMNDADDSNFMNDFDGSEYRHYLFHWIIDSRKVTFVNFYHPSSGYFSSSEEQSIMKQFLDDAFKE